MTLPLKIWSRYGQDVPPSQKLILHVKEFGSYSPGRQMDRKAKTQADIHTDRMKTLPSCIKGMGFEVGCCGIDEQDVQITLKLFFSCRWWHISAETIWNIFLARCLALHSLVLEGMSHKGTFINLTNIAWT